MINQSGSLTSFPKIDFTNDYRLYEEKMINLRKAISEENSAITSEWLTNFTKLNAKYINSLVACRQSRVKEPLANFLKCLSFEKTKIPTEYKDTHSEISVTALLQFIKQTKFSESARNFTDHSELIDVFEKIQIKAKVLLKEYRITVFAAETIRLITPYPTSINQNDPTILTQTMTDWLSAVNTKKHLFSIGYRLPNSFHSHEMIGYVHGKKLKVIDNSIQNSDSSKSYCRIFTYHDVNNIWTASASLLPFQITQENVLKIAKIKQLVPDLESEQIAKCFHRNIFQRFATSGMEESLSEFSPLSHLDWKPTKGCTFNFFLPLLCILCKEILEENDSHPFDVNQHLECKKILVSIVLQFKFWSFSEFKEVLDQKSQDQCFLNLRTEESLYILNEDIKV